MKTNFWYWLVSGFFSLIILSSSISLGADFSLFCDNLRTQQREMLKQENYLLSLSLLNIIAASQCPEEKISVLDFERAAHAFKLQDGQLYRYFVTRRLQTPEEHDKALLFDYLTMQQFATSSEFLPLALRSPELEFWSFRNSLTDLSKLPPLDISFRELASHYVEQNKNEKSSVLAGGLNLLLPGVGYAYAGAYQSAFLSFSINSLLAFTTFELMRHHLPFSASLSGVLFSVTYVGSALGAYKAVSDENRASQRTLDKRYLNQMNFFGFPLGDFQ